MNRFLLSLILLLLVPASAQAKRIVIPPGLKYDRSVVIKTDQVESSRWGIVTQHDGCRVLVVLLKQPKREVKQPVRNPYANTYRPVRVGPTHYYVAPTPKPVIITNPYVE